jgi:aspartate/glutamate racemase
MEGTIDIADFPAIPLDGTHRGHVYRYVHRSFEASAFTRYLAFQRAAATAFPVEADRPHVVVDCGRRNAARQLLLVGGMGPLSDASVSRAVARALRDANVRLMVISMPPPRTDAARMAVHARCVVRAASALVTTHACECYLVSNTAHTVFWPIASVFRLAVPKARLYDLVACTVDYLQAKYAGRVDAVVLLTTKVAWGARLYEARFDAAFARIRRASPSEIDRVQRIVDMGKSGARPARAFAMLVNHIRRKLPVAGQRTLIFAGCTDFRFVVSGGASLRARLGASFPGAFVEDSDELFSDAIATSRCV